MTDLARALIEQLDADDLEELARQLAPFLPAPAAAVDGWLATPEAAAYAGCPASALHKARKAGEIEFKQNGPGGKAYFRRADLDRWRQQ